MFCKNNYFQGSTGDAEVSVFVFDIKNGGEYQLEIARAAVKRLKTLKHPNILSYLDSLEVNSIFILNTFQFFVFNLFLKFQTEKMVYLATERVKPLHSRLATISEIGEGSKRELYFSWGIFQITVKISEFFLYFLITIQFFKSYAIFTMFGFIFILMKNQIVS